MSQIKSPPISEGEIGIDVIALGLIEYYAGRLHESHSRLVQPENTCFPTRQGVEDAVRRYKELPLDDPLRQIFPNTEEDYQYLLQCCTEGRFNW